MSRKTKKWIKKFKHACSVEPLGDTANAQRTGRKKIKWRLKLTMGRSSKEDGGTNSK